MIFHFFQHIYIMSIFCIALVIMFVVFFAVGPGSIPWFLVSELFSQSARPLATSMAVSINWTANFIVGLGFLPIEVSMISESEVKLVTYVALLLYFFFSKTVIPIIVFNMRLISRYLNIWGYGLVASGTRGWIMRSSDKLDCSYGHIIIFNY